MSCFTSLLEEGGFLEPGSAPRQRSSCVTLPPSLALRWAHVLTHLLAHLLVRTFQSLPGLSKICNLASEREGLASAVLSLSSPGARRPWAPKDPQIGRWRRWSHCLPKDTGLWSGLQGPSTDTARGISVHLSQA